MGYFLQNSKINQRFTKLNFFFTSFLRWNVTGLRKSKWGFSLVTIQWMSVYVVWFYQNIWTYPLWVFCYMIYLYGWRLTYWQLYGLFTWSKVQNFLQNVQLQKFCKNFADFFAKFLQLFCNFFAIFLQIFCNFFAIFFQNFCKLIWD